MNMGELLQLDGLYLENGDTFIREEGHTLTVRLENSYFVVIADGVMGQAYSYHVLSRMKIHPRERKP